MILVLQMETSFLKKPSFQMTPLSELIRANKPSQCQFYCQMSVKNHLSAALQEVSNCLGTQGTSWVVVRTDKAYPSPRLLMENGLNSKALSETFPSKESDSSL